MDDVSLMLRIAQRDEEALGTLYDRYADIVFGLCLRMLGERADAEDVVLEIFAEVWERSTRYDVSRANPLTYLLTLTRSRAIDRIRARPKVRPASLDYSKFDGATREPADTRPKSISGIELSERQLALADALKTLQPAQREAIEQAFFDGMSHSEIAEKSQRPLGTVKTNIRMGLIRLRNCLRKLGMDDL